MRVPFLNSFELPLSSSGLHSPLRQYVAVVQSVFSLSILSFQIEQYGLVQNSLPHWWHSKGKSDGYQNGNYWLGDHGSTHGASSLV